MDLTAAVSVTAGVQLPDVCTLLLGRIPSSHLQETAPYTGRQTGAARGGMLAFSQHENEKCVSGSGISRQFTSCSQLYQSSFMEDFLAYLHVLERV